MELRGEVRDWLSKAGARGELEKNLPMPALWNRLGPEEQELLLKQLDQNGRPEGASTGSGIAPVADPQPANPEYGATTPSTQGADQSDDGKILSDASPDPITDGQRYAQAGGRPPTRRPGPGGGTPREETRRDFFELHRAELEKLEPGNPKLSYVVPPGWVPSQRNVDEMAREAANARARAATRAQPGEAAPNSGNSDLSADDLVRGSVLGGIRSRTPESKSDAPAKLSPSDQLATNRMAGREQERDVYSQLQQQNPRIGAQITLETPSGTKTRIDFMTRHPTTG